MLNSNGDVQLTYAYTEFGKTTTFFSEYVDNPYRYNAECVDYVPGVPDFQYLRARYYAPHEGRFIQQDTLFGDVMVPLSQNLYAYGMNNPLMFVDPSGKTSVPVSIIMAGPEAEYAYLKAIGQNPTPVEKKVEEVTAVNANCDLSFGQDAAKLEAERNRKIREIYGSCMDMLMRMRLDGSSEEEKYLKKRIHETNNVKIPNQVTKYLKKIKGVGNYSQEDVNNLVNMLKWDQEKIDLLWEKAQDKSLDIGMPIDPRFLMAIIITEGTGSFNTNGDILAGDGGHGIQPDYKKDMDSALALIASKMVGYPKYKESFKEAASQAGVSGDIFNYINYRTPIMGRSQSGVYAGSNYWGNTSREIYSDLIFGDNPSGKYDEIINKIQLEDVKMIDDLTKYIFVPVKNGVIAKVVK